MSTIELSNTHTQNETVIMTSNPGFGAKPETSLEPVLMIDSHEIHDRSLREKSLHAFNSEIAARPRTVFIRFKVFDIKSIDPTIASATVDFAVYLRWFDPSLIHVTKADFGRTGEEYEQLWHPKLEVNNDQGLQEMWDTDTSWNLKDYETGEIKYSQRYRGVIGNRIDLKNFPFDSDVLTFKFGPKFYKEEKLVFEHDPDFSADDTSVGHLLDEWTVALPVTVDFMKGKFGHRNIALNLIVHRNSGYYLWKVLLINLITGMFSWTVFLVPVIDISDRINSTLTLFLAEVAFLFVIADKLPQVSYLTVMDKIILSSFVLLFLTALESCIAYSFVAEGKFFSSSSGPNAEIAEKFDEWSICLFPLAFFGLHIVCVWRALFKRTQLKKMGTKAIEKML
jgi:hypothetical protein